MNPGNVNSTTPQGTASIPVPVDSEDNRLILRGRVRSPGTVKSVFGALWFADFQNMQMRAIIQRMLDGFPPYDNYDDKRFGQFGRTNVNWGFVRRAFDEEVAPYNDILESMSPICYLPTNYGENRERDWIEPILAEAFDEMIRAWGGFYPMWLQLVHLFVSEGVGMTIFEDDLNWEWTVQGLQHIKFPRRVHPDINDVDMFVAKVDMTCSKLFKYVKNRAYAEKAGWDVPGVQMAISKAAPVAWIPSDFEEWQKIRKNLDIIPTDTPPEVQTLHAWVAELDGTWSHYIAWYDGPTDGNFLFKKEGMFRSADAVGTLFCYDVGSNGDLHSIRGLPHHLFNPGVALDRVLSAMADATVQSATTVIQSPSEDALNGLPFRQIGPMMAMNEGWKFIKQETPPTTESLIPFYETVLPVFNARQDANSKLMGQNGAKKGPYVSDQQQSQAAITGGQLSASAMNLFFAALDRHFKQVARRVCRPTYAQNEPGGEQVWWLRNYLVARGVPLKALYEIDISRVRVNRGLGRGSQAARQAMIETLMQRKESLDPQGQNRLMRMWVTANSNARIAAELVPNQPGMRPPEDLEDANNENGLLLGPDMLAAMMVVLQPNQNHIVHCGAHIEGLQKLFALNARGQMPPEQAVQRGVPAHAHAVQHWKLINPETQEYSAFKAQLQQMDEFFTNESKHLAAQQQKAQEKMAQQGGNGSTPAGGMPQGGNGNSVPQAPQADTGGLLNEAVHSADELAFSRQMQAAKLSEAQAKAQLAQLKRGEAVQQMMINRMGPA